MTLFPFFSAYPVRTVRGIGIALLLSLAFSAAMAAPRCDTLVVSGNPEYPPMLWPESGRLTGAVAAYLRELFEPLGIRVETRDPGSWARVLHMARRGEIDVVAGVFMTDQRRRYLDYIVPPMTWAPTHVWVPKNRTFDYRYWSDLRGKRGATLIDNSFGQSFDEFIDGYLAVERLRTIEQAFLMAKLGRVDYVLYGGLQGDAKLTHVGLEHEFVALRSPVSNEALHLALPKGSSCNTPALRQQMVERIEVLTGQRRMDELVMQYNRRYAEQIQSRGSARPVMLP